MNKLQRKREINFQQLIPRTGGSVITREVSNEVRFCSGYPRERLDLIVDPMCCDKTSELLRRIRRFGKQNEDSARRIYRG